MLPRVRHRNPRNQIEPHIDVTAQLPREQRLHARLTRHVEALIRHDGDIQTEVLALLDAEPSNFRRIAHHVDQRERVGRSAIRTAKRVREPTLDAIETFEPATTGARATSPRRKIPRAIPDQRHAQGVEMRDDDLATVGRGAVFIEQFDDHAFHRDVIRPLRALMRDEARLAGTVAIHHRNADDRFDRRAIRRRQHFARREHGP